MPKKDNVDYSNYDDLKLIDQIVYKVERNGEWAVIDFKENILIDFDSVEIKYFAPRKLFYKKNLKNPLGYYIFSLEGKLLNDKLLYIYIYIYSNPKYDLKDDYYKIYDIVNGKNKYGLINFNGEMIASPMYEQCRIFDENKIFISNNDTSYLVNMNLDTLTNGYKFIGSKNENGLIGVGTFDNKYGAINEFGVEIIETKYMHLYIYRNAIEASLDEELYGLMDSLGNSITKFEFDDLSYLFSGIFEVCKNGLWGLINSKGEEVYPIECNKRFKQSHVGSFKVTRNGKVGIIDCEGGILVPVDYDNVKPMATFYIRYYQVFSNGKTGAFARNGTKLIDVKYDSLSFKSKDKAEVIINDQVKLIEVSN